MLCSSNMALMQDKQADNLFRNTSVNESTDSIRVHRDILTRMSKYRLLIRNGWFLGVENRFSIVTLRCRTMNGRTRMHMFANS